MDNNSSSYRLMVPCLLYCVLSLLCFATSEVQRGNEELHANVVAEVLLYENTHASPAFTTILGFCKDRIKLLRSLSKTAVSALVVENTEKSLLTLKRIAKSDPGDRMLAGARDCGRGIPNAFLLDLSCNDAYHVLIEAGKLGLLKSPYRWLLLGDVSIKDPKVDSPDIPCNESLLSDVPLRADSQVTMGCRQANTTSDWIFRHYFRAAPNATVTAQHRGQWTNRELTLNRQSTMLLQRDLQGYPVGASFVITNNDSLKHLTDGVDRHIDALSKATFDNVLTVLQMINSTPFFRFVDTWGYTRVKGQWQHGMLGLMQQGEVDIGGTASLPMSVRMDAMTYLVFSTPIYGIFLFRAPPISYEYNIFTLPFATSVWTSSAFVLSLCCILLFPVMIYEGRKGNYRVEEEFTENEKASSSSNQQTTLGDILLCGFAAVCQQGSTVHARGISSRIITLWLHLFVICLYTSFTASIVVLLQTSGTSIRTLHDFWKSGIGAAAEDAPYNLFFFMNSTDPVRRGIYHDKMLGKNPTNNFMTVREGVELTRTQFFGFHAITHNIYFTIGSTWREEEKCSLVEFDNYLPSNIIALTIRRNSPYEEMIRLKFYLLYERGHRDRLLRRIVYPRPKCPPNMVRFSSVSVTDIVAAIQLFGAGLSVSLLVLLTEVLVHRWFRFRKRNMI